MDIEFIGVGEAFDPELGNASYLIHSKTKLLIDLGYAAAPLLFQAGCSANFIDGVYISHFHADHVFGVPALITRAFEEGRTKELVFIGQPGIEKYILTLMELAYPAIVSRAKFSLRFVESTTEVSLNELNLAFAPTMHSTPNYALKVKLMNGKSAAFSGDGGLTMESRELFHGVNLLVHEAYMVSDIRTNHCSVNEVVDFAQTAQIDTVCLVHINRDERRKHHAELTGLENRGDNPKLVLPLPGTIISI
jgi:ribonuclease Z